MYEITYVIPFNVTFVRKVSNKYSMLPTQAVCIITATTWASLTNIGVGSQLFIQE